MVSRVSRSKARKGRVDRYSCMMGRSNRELAMKRLSPTGGVLYPMPKLAKKMTPKWMGSTPNYCAKGIMRGTTTRMALNISIIHPTRMRKTLSINRKPILLFTKPSRK